MHTGRRGREERKKSNNIPLTHAGGAARAAVRTGHILLALGEASILVGAERRNALQLGAAVTALGGGRGLLDVQVRKLATGRLNAANGQGGYQKRVVQVRRHSVLLHCIQQMITCNTLSREITVYDSLVHPQFVDSCVHDWTKSLGLLFLTH